MPKLIELRQQLDGRRSFCMSGRRMGECSVQAHRSLAGVESKQVVAVLAPLLSKEGSGEVLLLSNDPPQSPLGKGGGRLANLSRSGAGLMFTASLVACLMAASAATAVAADPPKPSPEDEPKNGASAESDEEQEPEKDAEDKKKDKPEDRYFAVTGGLIHTVTRGDIVAGTILSKNGKIIDIGTNIALPDDCEVLDATGYYIYPGLVVTGGGGLLGGEPPEDTSDVYSLGMTIGLAAGITTGMSGNTAAKLSFGFIDDMIVKRNVLEKLSYATTRPEERRKLRVDFDRVRQYQRDVEAYQEKKRTDPEAEEPDKEWLKGNYEKYDKLLRRETTAVFSANTAAEIVGICDFVEHYGIRAVIRGAVEGWTVASRMARAGVSAVITPRDRSQRDERATRANGSSIENAAILHRHGVRLAVLPPISSITLWGLAGRDLLQLNMEAAFAVRGGLPEEAAIRALTIDAAQILGIDHRVGSIEIGKDADLAITDGDILHYMTHTRWTVVNGRIAYDKQKESLYSHIRPGGDQDAPPPDDYWPHRLGAGQ